MTRQAVSVLLVAGVCACVSFTATLWALNHGHARWVVLAGGAVVVALIVLLNRALRGTWSLW